MLNPPSFCIILSMLVIASAGLCASAATAQPSQDMPLPERNPLRVEQPQPPAPPPHPREREAEDWTAQEIQDGLETCAMMLDGSGAVYSLLEPIREGVCGAPAPIELKSIGTVHQVTIDPPAKVTCGLAASLSAWSDSVLQEAARKHLGHPVISIRNVASYVCRNRYNAPDTRVSEHARANALDMASFTLEDGAIVKVLDHWNEMLPPDSLESSVPSDSSAKDSAVELPTAGPPAPPPPVKEQATANPGQESEQDAKIEPPAMQPSEKARFLHEIHAGGCALFGTVLGPLANEAHKDHFHFDQAPRKHSNFCE